MVRKKLHRIAAGMMLAIALVSTARAQAPASPPTPASVQAAAKDQLRPSIEWLVDAYPSISFGTVLGTKGGKPVPGAAPGSPLSPKSAEIMVSRALAGKPPPFATIDGDRLESTWPPPLGQEFVLFFDAAGKPAWAIDLDLKGGALAFTSDFRVLRGRDAVLGALKKRLDARGRNAAPANASATVDVPPGSEAHDILKARGTSRLVVPASAAAAAAPAAPPAASTAAPTPAVPAQPGAAPAPAPAR